MTSSVNAAQVRGINSPADLRGLLGLLGFDAEPVAHDVTEEFPQATYAEVLQHGGRRARGYALLVTELDQHPRSFQKLGRHLITDVHDRPLAFCGVRGEEGVWSELVVLRPRWLVKRRDDDRRKEVLEVARLTIDLAHPTAHDLEILRDVSWGRGDDVDRGYAAQGRIDRAFDTERVTKRFFEGLEKEYGQLLDAVKDVCTDPKVKEGVAAAGGADRVALRFLTQTLFCYFLQRKGLLEADRHWLANSCRAARGRGEPLHQSVLEPLFYEALAKPPPRRDEPWDQRDIPFLNGGLFECLYGDVSLPIPDEALDPDRGLIGFLDRWTFTVAEERPGEPEVAVDPEMLGKVFESLAPAPEKEALGIIYTPRPVVRFMCREALVPHLEQSTPIWTTWSRSLTSVPASADKCGRPRSPTTGST